MQVDPASDVGIVDECRHHYSDSQPLVESDTGAYQPDY